MIIVKRETFQAFVLKALERLPAEFQQRLENVDVVVEDWPARRQLVKMGLRRRGELLGLYEGVPQTRRSGGYNMVLPDRITLFQKPIEARCRSLQEVEREIERVLWHEIAHHFGISDKRLREIEEEKRGME